MFNYNIWLKFRLFLISVRVSFWSIAYSMLYFPVAGKESPRSNGGELTGSDFTGPDLTGSIV